MTNSKFKFVFIALIAIGLSFTSCSSESNNTAKTEQTTEQNTEQSKEYTSAYVCPMHCEGSGSEVAGKCPVCGMDYVKNEAHTSACPMHPEVTGMNGDKCSKCGMDLTTVSGDDHEGHDH